MNGIIPDLFDRFASMKRAVICFSGGLDSTVLLNNAVRALPDDHLAVFAILPMTTQRQIDVAKKIVSTIGANAIFVEIGWSEMKGVEKNGPDRCYLCKTSIYEKVRAIASERGFSVVVAGENADDVENERPGRKAGRENGIVCPLLDLGIGRDRVIQCVNEIGFPFPMIKDTCMATRYSEGIPINEEMMRDAEECEESIRSATGVIQLRVRFNGNEATVLTDLKENGKLLDNVDIIRKILNDKGIDNVTVDSKGYHGK